MANPLNGIRVLFGHLPKTDMDTTTDQEYLDLWDQVAALVETFPKSLRFDLGTRSSAYTSIYWLKARVDEIDAKLVTKRSKELLYDHLTKNQISDLEKLGEFKIKMEHNTYFVDNEARVGAQSHETHRRFLCVSTRDPSLPIFDKILAVKLYIEGNEKEFLKTANVSGDYSLKLDQDGVLRRNGRTIGNEEPIDYARINATLNETLAGLRVVNTNAGRFYETLNITNAIDATTFGDTNRTYLAGPTTITTNATIGPGAFDYET